MLFSVLAADLQKQFPDILCSIQEDSLLSQWLFYSSDAKSFQPDILYVAVGDRALTRQHFPHDLVVLFRDEEEKQALEAHFEQSTGPVNLLFYGGGDNELLLNLLQEKLQTSRWETDRYSGFLRMVINGRSLSFLLTEAAKQCGRQLVALDSSGKILGASPVKSYMTEDWRGFLQDGYCPAYSMQHINDLLLARTEISAQPYSYLCEDNGLSYLSSPVIIDGYPYGYVFLLSPDNEFGQVAYEILPILSKVVGDYIQRSMPDLSGRYQMFNNLLKDILRGETPNAVQSRLAAAKLKIPERMRLVVIRTYYFEREQDLMKTLSSQLTMAFGRLAPIRFDNNLVLLQDMHPEYAEQNGKALAFLRHLAVTNRLSVGISNEFTKLDDLAKYYEQATEAIRLASQLRLEQSIVYYRDISFFSLLCRIPSSEKILSFCHPALEVLRRYDAENGTDLFETLRVYIEVNCNQKLAAERLFTHRNTIAYRRQQIIDLTGIDFTDQDEVFQLTFSFKVYQFSDR